MTDRKATISRDTSETEIKVSINLDGTGISNINSSIAFLDHMLEQIARHGAVDLDIQAKGDIDIDFHHTVEDIGIALGTAYKDALGDKKGITRYGHAYVPLDEALSRVVIDFSGRPGIEFDATFPTPKVGIFDTELFFEFFQGFANASQSTLHIDNLKGRNSHHIAETIFKAFGRAVRMAVTHDTKAAGIVPSTKGTL